jgi:hypothetical protein
MIETLAIFAKAQFEFSAYTTQVQEGGRVDLRCNLAVFFCRMCFPKIDLVRAQLPLT